MKPARFLQPVFACLTACVALAQQGAGPAAPPDDEDETEVVEEVDFTAGRAPDPAMLLQLNRMLPVGGKAHEGLRYPVYARLKAEGAPVREALFESKRVTRMDDTHILFEGAVHKSYGDPKKPDRATRTISLKDAIYDLQHNLLFSNAPIVVEDQEISIHCGGAVHDLTTGLTVYTGGVELFFDDEPAEKKPAATAKPASVPDKSELKTPANPASPK